MKKKDLSRVRALRTCNTTIVEHRRRAALIKTLPIGVPVQITFRGINYNGQCWTEWMDGYTCLVIATHFNSQSLAVRVAATDNVYPVVYHVPPGDFTTWIPYRRIQSWMSVKRSDYPLFMNHEVKTNFFYQLLKEEE